MACYPDIERTHELSTIVVGIPDGKADERIDASDARSSPRHRLAVPVWISEITADGAAGVCGYQLEDISGSGLGIVATRPFTPGRIVLANLTANNTMWNGRTRVVHCTERGTDYKIGLALIDTSILQSPFEEAETNEPSDKCTTLDRLKDDIGKAMRAYRLARRTWGLLGVAVKEQIRGIIRELGPLPVDKDDNPRPGTPRAAVDGDVHVIVPTNLGWKWLPAWIANISEGGAGLFIPFEFIYDEVENELAGEFRLESGMAILIGVGAEPGVLWLPAEIAHRAGSSVNVMRVGVAFNTPNAQEAFGA